MKISKLFHWLYAFLMFLPVTFLLPSLLYFGFNDNATAQEYTKEEPVYYQTNEVNSVTDIYDGFIYHFNSENIVYGQVTHTLYFESFYNFSSTESSVRVFESTNLTIPRFSFDFHQYFSYEMNIDDTRSLVNEYSDNAILSFDFVASSNNNYSYFVDCISKCNYQVVKEYQEVTYSMGITESINQSILDTFDLPMFSWASDNFIIAPFNYITNLFGLPEGNVVNKYLDYWLSISIIYLCFDVIMYVPLLVHRWLDKGIVE